ncbi:MAG: tRNA (guanosine(37)-N1)-methyltransferase TrmD [Chloroflexota bacterium]|nr:tRNA (guanosine(37)-N1)-methyltransferase TrmD [Chloroflexota bacterium]
MRFDIFTTLPAMFQGPLSESIIKRGVARGLLQIEIHDIRAWATDKHRTTDAPPFGGGAGMVMKPAPIFAAVEQVLGMVPGVPSPTPVLLLGPGGDRFTQALAERLSLQPRLALICGHYEGVDDRVRQHLATDEISIGDYVLSGGELPAMVVVDTVARLVPGVIKTQSRDDESHTLGLLEYPQYTRPAVFRDMPAPEILLSGDHGAVDQWRREQAIRRTATTRPEMLAAWRARQEAEGE